jgi:hypothetical protein
MMLVMVNINLIMLLSNIYYKNMKNLIKNVLNEYLNEQKVNLKWTKELAHQEALKYNSKSEFEKGSNKAYNAAIYNKWLNDITQHMKPKNKKWTYDEVYNEARKYSFRDEFKKKSPAHYSAALRNKWINQVCSHMKPRYIKWTKEMVKKEAEKYTSRSEFERESPKAYEAAYYNGWLKEITNHMEYLGNRVSRLVYAYEFPDNSVYVGLTYNKDKRNDQHLKSGSVYQYKIKTNLTPVRVLKSDYIPAQEASKLERKILQDYANRGWNILNRVEAGNLGGNTIKYSEEMIKDIASKYKTQQDFRLNEPKAYNAAKRHGWYDSLGLENTFNTWDFDKVKDEALKYNSRNEFRKNNIGAYDFAKRNNILDDITKHMKKRTQWTKELAKIEALKYLTRIDFAKNSKKAYDAASKYGWLDDITTHMTPKRKNQFG